MLYDQRRHVPSEKPDTIGEMYRNIQVPVKINGFQPYDTSYSYPEHDGGRRSILSPADVGRGTNSSCPKGLSQEKYLDHWIFEI